MTKLKEIRTKKSLTQADVSARLKIATATYTRYETGERQMSYEVLLELSDFFGVSIDQILGRCDANPMVFTKDEIDLINKYRKLDERSQKSIQALVNYEYTQNKK